MRDIAHDHQDVADQLREYRRTGDRRIRNEVIHRHRYLADIVAGDYLHRGVERDDLRQIALLGLVKAVDRFDPSVGTAFSTFASIVMNGQIKRHFRDQSWDVRPPRRIQQLNHQVREASDTLTQELHRAPTVAELADHVGISKDRVIEARSAAAAYRADHLDAPSTGGNPGTTRMVRLGVAERGFERSERSDLVDYLLGTLSARDAEILRLRFYAELTQEEIAARVGVSQEHVSKLIRRSVTKLQHRHDVRHLLPS